MESERYSTIKEIEEKYKRTGKCNGCGECCKYMVFESVSKQRKKYFSGFGFEFRKIGKLEYAVLYKQCKYLKNNKCTIWKTKKFPMACYHFPLKGDNVYALCRKKCGFKFADKKLEFFGNYE